MEEHIISRDPLPGADSGAKVLTFGILGVAFGCVPFLGILGIIFSGIARKKAVLFQSAYGGLFGQAKVGSILSIVGIPLSIGMAAFWEMYFGIFFFAIVMAVLAEKYYAITGLVSLLSMLA